MAEKIDMVEKIIMFIWCFCNWVGICIISKQLNEIKKDFDNHVEIKKLVCKKGDRNV